MSRPRFTWTALPRVEIWILLAVVAVTGALAAFAALADEVGEGETGRIDQAILLAFREPGHPDIPIGPRWIQEAARDVTALGGFTVLVLVSLAAIALLLIHRRRLQALVFGLTVTTAQLGSELLKTWIDRPRPAIVDHLDLVYSSSFPSGHAMMTPAIYLTLAGILAAGERTRREKALLVGGAAALSVAVGVSRVYLGVHWPTDVLGGWMLGAAIALAATVILRRTAPRREPAVTPAG